MTNLFNHAEAQRLKTEGMEKAACYPCDEPVAIARNIAILLAKRNGEVCADNVHEYMAERMPMVLDQINGPAWGSVFRSPRLTFTGKIVESKRTARHCGSQRLWRIADR